MAYRVASEHVDRVRLLEEMITNEVLCGGIGGLHIRVIKDCDEPVDNVLGIALLETVVLGALDIAAVRTGNPVGPAGSSSNCGGKSQRSDSGEELHFCVSVVEMDMDMIEE